MGYFSNLICKPGRLYVRPQNDRPCGALPLINSFAFTGYPDDTVINAIGGDGLTWRVTKDSEADRFVNGNTYPGNEARIINNRARCTTDSGLPGNLDWYQLMLTQTPYGLVGDNNVKIAMDFYVPDLSGPKFGRQNIWLFARADTRQLATSRCSIVAAVDLEGESSYKIVIYKATKDAPFWSIIHTNANVPLAPNQPYTLTLQICGTTVAVFLDGDLVHYSEQPDLDDESLMPKAFKGVGFGFGGNINNVSQGGTALAGVEDFYLFS